MNEIKMSTGRSVLNPLAQAQPETEQAVASSDKQLAIAAVDNSVDGVCPKCRATMGIAIIPLGQVYYCSTCRVTTPIPEE